MIVSAYVPGLMDRSRFDRHDITFVSTAQDAIDAAATLVLVDLDRCDEPAVFRIDGAKVIGFGSHVDADRLAEAEALWVRRGFATLGLLSAVDRDTR